MKKETLKALNGSIKKWVGIKDGTAIDNGTDNCPLCRLYFDYGCYDCPVEVKMKMVCCEGTPYQKWSRHQEDSHGMFVPFKVECLECKDLAIKELEFLRSLRESV